MAAPNDSGNNGGGWGSVDAKSLLIFGIGYGVASTIATKTIAYFTSSGSVSRDATPPPSKKNTNPPPHCKYVWRFYEDCLREKTNDCGPYRDIIKRCHEGVSSQKDDDPTSASNLTLLLMSYHGSMTQDGINAMDGHKFYKKYLKENMKAASE